MFRIPHATVLEVAQLVIPKILGMTCCKVGSVVLRWLNRREQGGGVLGWLRERSARRAVARDGLRRVVALETLLQGLQDRLEASVGEVRASTAAWKSIAQLQTRVEGTERRVAQMHEDLASGLASAHQTARLAVDTVKGMRGGRGRSSADADALARAEKIIELAGTPQGRQELRRELEKMDGPNGAAGESPIMGDTATWRG
ncbi:MAG: hypothetical protein RI885_2339 [Actinomycetota bacterium]|jgi:hypothetical protein